MWLLFLLVKLQIWLFSRQRGIIRLSRPLQFRLLRALFLHRHLLQRQRLHLLHRPLALLPRQLMLLRHHPLSPHPHQVPRQNGHNRTMHQAQPPNKTHTMEMMKQSKSTHQTYLSYKTKDIQMDLSATIQLQPQSLRQFLWLQPLHLHLTLHHLRSPFLNSLFHSSSSVSSLDWCYNPRPVCVVMQWAWMF